MHKLAPIILIVGAVAALKSNLVSHASMRSQAELMSEQTGNNKASC
jgi:hypothetical protein